MERVFPKRLFTPGGWLVIRPGETLYLAEPVELPHYRAMDVGSHRKTLTTSVTSIYYPPAEGTGPSQPGPEPVNVEDLWGRGVRFRLVRLGRECAMKLTRASIFEAPLGSFAHSLAVACREAGGGRYLPADASILLYLMNPSIWPEYASRVFRTAAWASEDHPRWKPWEALGIRVEVPETKFQRPVDALRQPKCIKALWESTLDLQPEVRAALHQCGLWRDPPMRRGATGAEGGQADYLEPGRYTLAGALALMTMVHMLPKIPRKYLPGNLQVPDAV